MCALRLAEIESVMALDGPKRCEYFVKRVADLRQLWGLHYDSGWLICANPDNRQCFPVWPHEEYALRFSEAQSPNCDAKTIALDDWLTRWQLGMSRDGVLVSVFPTPELKAVVIDIIKLNELIIEELKKIE
jgi:hypothetical protein